MLPVDQYGFSRFNLNKAFILYFLCLFVEKYHWNIFWYNFWCFRPYFKCFCLALVLAKSVKSEKCGFNKIRHHLCFMVCHLTLSLQTLVSVPTCKEVLFAGVMEDFRVILTSCLLLIKLTDLFLIFIWKLHLTNEMCKIKTLRLNRS